MTKPYGFTGVDASRSLGDLFTGRSQLIELPGISVFSRDGSGDVYHTYSTYARGLDMLSGAYDYMDLLPKGRDEERLSWTMAWLRRHDQYEA